MPDVPDSQPKTHSRSVGETVSTGDSVTATVSRAATEIKYSTSSQNALRLAEGVRTHLGDGQVTTEMLLYGLAAKTNGAAQAFVAVRQGAEPVVRIAAEFGWKEIRTTRVERLPEEFTPNASRVLDIAKTFATRGRVRDRHLFAAILEVPESLACRWLTRIFEPDVPMDLVRRALREWPPDQVFTVGTVSVALQKRQANEVQSPPAAASVAPQLGGILSEASCQLIVLPCSSAGTTSEWVEDIIREYGLVHPRPMPFGTLSEAERRDGRTFVFASSVEDQTSNVAAIRTIGVALGQLATSKQLDVIGTPLLGAGTNPNGRERIPAEMSFQALAAGFREGATRASLLLVLIPEKERFQRIQRSLAIADTGQGAGAVKTPDWASRAYLATHASDVAEGNDLLSLRREVDALSALLVSTSVEPPVSVGLFGEWGSGKSFFMKELSDSIAARAAASKETKDDLFCANVVQIKFNAWHYVDANLWASLVANIFGKLAEDKQYRAVLGSLATTQTLREQVQAKLTAAEARRLQAETNAAAAAKAHQDQLATALGNIKLADVVKDQVLDKAVVKAPRDLGLDTESIDELSRRLNELRSLGGRAAAFWRWRAAGKLSLSLLALSAIALAALPVAWMEAPQWHEYLRRIGAAASSAILLGSTLVGALLPAFRRVVTNAEALRSRIDGIAAAKAAQAAEQQRQANASLKEAEDVVRALNIEKEELESGRRLYQFIEERAGSSDYSRHLGLIALIHKDFKRLDELLRSTSEKKSAQVGTPLDRIILYIDDLDRCGVEHVVQVLQAVHLLLAFRLFVVVVGVDPRWLLQSLERHYRTLSGGGTHDQWTSTPHDYLEKIFQIPFAVRPMGADGYKSLISGLTERASDGRSPVPAVQTREPTKNRAPEETADVAVDASSDRAAAPISPKAATKTDVSPARELTVSVVEISDAERSFMQTLLHLLPTPRATKRFVNLYRLMRAIVDEDIVGRDTWRLPMILLALLIGEPTGAAGLFELIRRAPDGTWKDYAESLSDANAARAKQKLNTTLIDGPGLSNTNVQEIRRWIPVVSRYSFECSTLQ